jgi:hypothetical protein
VIRTTASFAQAFHAARRVSTPLMAVRTPDPASAIRLILSTLKDDETPALHWDAVRGLAGANEAGQRHASEILGELEPAAVWKLCSRPLKRLPRTRFSSSQTPIAFTATRR